MRAARARVLALVAAACRIRTVLQGTCNAPYHVKTERLTHRRLNHRINPSKIFQHEEPTEDYATPTMTERRDLQARERSLHTEY